MHSIYLFFNILSTIKFLFIRHIIFISQYIILLQYIENNFLDNSINLIIMKQKQDQPDSDQKINQNLSMVSTNNNSEFLSMNLSLKLVESRGQSPPSQSDLCLSNFFSLKNAVKKVPKPQNEMDSPWGQSSATWRHTSYKYSFSKDSRFKKDNCSHLDIQHLELPSSLANKSCTFGKGNRTPISEVSLRKAKFTPSPDRYNLNTYLQSTRKNQLGKSFGIPWQNYKKTYIKHRKDVYSGHFTDQNPPAIYQVREKPGNNKKKFNIHGRLKMFNQVHADLYRMNPGSVHQVNSILQTNTRGLNERNFGFGDRIDLAKPANNYPGPDHYNIKSFCSKFEGK